MTEVTAEDLKRDLAKDLAHADRTSSTGYFPAWPAAIRRALAAEADAAQLRETVHALEVENHTLRQELSQTTTATADQNAAMADIRARVIGQRAGELHSSVTERFVDNVVKGLREELDIMQDAASAVLPLLRDRFDGTAEEPLVDALEHALGGKE